MFFENLVFFAPWTKRLNTFLGFFKKKSRRETETHFFVFFQKSCRDGWVSWPGCVFYAPPPPSPLAKPSTASHPQRFRLGLRTSYRRVPHPSHRCKQILFFLLRSGCHTPRRCHHLRLSTFIHTHRDPVRFVTGMSRNITKISASTLLTDITTINNQ